MTALDIASKYVRKGWAVVPVRHREKECFIKGWPNMRLDSIDLPKHFNGRQQNIGVLLGEPSNWLIDIDLDHPKAVELAEKYLPPTSAVFGRSGKRKSHWLYRVTDAIKTKKFSSETHGCILELRSTRLATIFPGSTHKETGESIEWEYEGDPNMVSPETLLASCERLRQETKRQLGEVDLGKVEPPANQELIKRYGSNSPYVEAALRGEIEKVRNAPEGTRNDTLNAASFSIGRLVGGGYLDESRAEKELIEASRINGSLEEDGLNGVSGTIRSGMMAGRKNPRDIPPPTSSTHKPVATSRPNNTQHQDFDDVLQFSDSGNAKRLVESCGDSLRWCKAWGKWLVWDGRRWKGDDTNEPVRMAKQIPIAILDDARELAGDKAFKELSKWAAISADEPRIRKMLELAKCELAVTPDQLDSDIWVINVNNGTIDLKTGELRVHDRSELITKLAPVVYEPEAKHDTWDNFLDTAMAGDQELIGFLRRAVGYSLTGDSGDEKLFFNHGPAATGKSTFIEAIKATMGDYACTTDFETFVKKENNGIRNDLARLKGSRFVASVEVDDGKKLAEALLKTVTGGDTISVRFLNKEFFEYVPQFTLWLAANHAPTVSADDEAIWRRIVKVPFENVVPEHDRDPNVKRILRTPTDAGAAIMAWMVQGCLECQRDGLNIPASIRAATQAYRDEQDPIRDWLDECCRAVQDAWTATCDLYKSYTEWCSKNGRHPLGDRRFRSRIKDEGCAPNKKTLNGIQQRGWTGIELLVTL